MFHGDLKLSKIGLTRVNGALSAKVRDFGFAKVAVDFGDFSDHPPQQFYSLGYRAPEAELPMVGTELPSVGTEVFAFGRILVELLAGRRLSKYDDAVISSSMGAIGDMPPSAFLAANADGAWPLNVADALAKVALSCIAPDSRSRPQNMGVVIARLRAVRLLAAAPQAVSRVPFSSLVLGGALGSGATGDVFASTLHSVPVAVKRLKLAAVANARAELSRRFRAEVDVLSK